MDRTYLNEVTKQYLNLVEKFTELETIRVDFSENTHTINLEIETLQELKNLENELSEIEKNAKDIEEIVPKNFIDITGELLVEIYNERSKLHEKLRDFSEVVEAYEEDYSKVTSELESLRILLKQISAECNKHSKKSDPKINNIVQKIISVLNSIKKINEINKAIVKIENIKKELNKHIEAKSQISSLYSKLEKQTEIINKYLSTLKNLKLVDIKKWDYVFENSTEISSIIDKIGEREFRELENDVLKAELPEDPFFC